MNQYSDTQFGKNAIALGFINPEQLNECLQLQQQWQQQGQHYSLDKWLYQKKLLSLEQIEMVKKRCIDQLQNTAQNSPTSDTTQQSDLKLIPDRKAQGSQFGRYQIYKEIGRGGMGCVYQAYDAQLDRILALKVLLQGDHSTEQDVKRFIREAKATAKLRHPNIIGVHDIGCEQGQHFFTMDFIQGCTLKELIHNSTLTIKNTVAIMIKIANAVSYAHSQEIIHRDLKPANVMIDKNQEPIIMDFGLAKVQHQSKLSQTGMVIGTLQYMPPEQAEGKIKEIDERSDLYALGAMLYEMLTRRHLFKAATTVNMVMKIINEDPVAPSKINAKVSRDLENICLKTLQKEKSHRYQSAQELSQDLTRFANGETVKARPVSSINKILRLARRHVLLVVIVTLVLLSVALIILLVQTKPEESLVSKNIKKGAKEIQSFLKRKQYDKAQQKAQALLLLHPHSIVIHRLLALSFEKKGQIKNALKIYQDLHLQIQNPKNLLKNKQDIIRCCIQLGLFHEAGNILAKTKFANTPRWNSLAIKTFFHKRQWNRANKLLLKTKAPLPKLYLKWLQSLTPMTNYLCEGRLLGLVDIDQNGIKDIAIRKKNELIIYSLQSGQLKLLYKVHYPKKHFKEIVVADLDYDNQVEIIARVPNEVVVFKKDNNQYKFWIAHRCNAAKIEVVKLAQKTAIAIAIGPMKRNSKLLFYQNNKWKSISIDPRIKASASNTTDVDIGDVTGNGVKELVLSTDFWTLYGVRVYSYTKKRFLLKAYKKLGVVTGCVVIDMDQDGKAEICALKSYTYNSEVFASNPFAKPDGVYIFSFRKKYLHQIWNDTFLAGANPVRHFISPKSGILKPIGPVIVCTHHFAFTEKMQEKLEYYPFNFDSLRNLYRLRANRYKSKKELWLISYTDKKYQRISCSYGKISGYAIGDIDGDGKEEFLFSEKRQLFVCGAKK